MSDHDDIPTPAQAEPDALYKFSEWVEVDGKRVWCRLPNILQEREIKAHAFAAKARRIRQLRTDGSDGNEILETELEELIAEPDAVKRMAQEVVGRSWSEDYLEAIRTVRDLDDDGEGVEPETKLYAHIDEDRARHQRLMALPESERNKDEFDDLVSHVARYAQAVQDAYDAISAPKIASLEAMNDLDLQNLVRRERIKAAGQEEFMHAYSVHEWLSCTYTDETAGTPFFTDLAELERAAPELLLALQDTFADLERHAQEARGN